jgi:chromosome partitioning protein
MAVAIEAIGDIQTRSQDLMRKLKELNFAPDGNKQLNRQYSIGEAASLVGRTTQGIRDAEARGELQEQPRIPGSNRRAGYSLAQVDAMRDIFGTRPNRKRDEDMPCVLSIQNFKGGVGKSTIATHVAQYLARAGMRTLLVDTDSQASTTYMMGYAPDIDLEEEDTLYPFFEGSERTLNYCIRDSYWENLKFIPANLALYQAEWILAAKIAKQGQHAWQALRTGLMRAANDFDVVIIDPPPQMGMVSLNVLYAATASVIPMPPGMLDFASTIQFFEMAGEAMQILQKHDGNPITYDFIKILISRKKEAYADREDAQNAMVDLAKSFYGDYVMNSIMYHSSEVESATSKCQTLYELTAPIGSRKTHKRAISMMDEVCNEILELVVATWPSHRRRPAAAAMV